jgi:hypothetical protein
MFPVTMRSRGCPVMSASRAVGLLTLPSLVTAGRERKCRLGIAPMPNVHDPDRP